MNDTACLLRREVFDAWALLVVRHFSYRGVERARERGMKGSTQESVCGCATLREIRARTETAGVTNQGLSQSEKWGSKCSEKGGFLDDNELKVMQARQAGSIVWCHQA